MRNYPLFDPSYPFSRRLSKIKGMKNLLLMLAFLLTIQGYAQETTEPREIEEFDTLSLWLPFHVGFNGRIRFLKDHPADSFVLSPMIQIGVQWKQVRFQPPVRTENFVLERNALPDEWLEVYRRRLSLGRGLGLMVKEGLKLGLIPYKGSKQRLVRRVRSGTPAPGLSLLPKNLRVIDSWSIGDQGSFETFGGVLFQLSSGAMIVSIANVGIELQSEFLLQIKKISRDEVKVGIYEGKSNRRQLTLGPLLANFSLGNFSGKRFGAEFILNISEDEDLYQKALEGKLHVLQQRLPHISQTLSFYGHSSTAYFGVPEIVGKSIRKGEVNMNEDGQESSMHFRSKNNEGFLLPRRDIHRFTYLSKNETILFWANEMSKVKGKVLDKYFLSIGRRLGLRDFNLDFEKNEKYGNVMTQLGISIQNSELPLFKGIDLRTLEGNYRHRCQELRLNCRKDNRRGKILREYVKVMKLELQDLRKGLGKLLMKNPSLLHSVLKTLRMPKEAYYLFLSDRFRSQEGKAEVLF